MVTTKLILEEKDIEAAWTLVELSQDPGKLLEEKTTSLTPEEEKESEHDEAVWALMQLSQTRPNQHNKRMQADKSQPEEVKTKRQKRKEDDSEETLRRLLQWNEIKPERPPFVRELEAVGVCSEPVRKQLRMSDVLDTQCRLMLGKKEVKKMMAQVMGHSRWVGTNGIDVLVHGPDGAVHEMVFKMWGGAPVLASVGWKNFVRDYGLEMNSDFLTIWMFKHSVTRQICFAIDVTRFPVEYPLSNKINKAAFQNLN